MRNCHFAWGVLAAFIFSTPCFAKECRLEKSIPFSGDFLKTLYIKNIKLDDVPKFTGGTFDPTRDSLSMSIFNIVHNDQITKYVGAHVYAPNKLMGFSQEYSGQFDLKGTKTEKDGITTYTTREVYTYSEPQHAKGEAVHEVKVLVRGKEIESVELTVPLFKIWKKDKKGFTYVAFTGEHQTLCVLSGN